MNVDPVPDQSALTPAGAKCPHATLSDWSACDCHTPPPGAAISARKRHLSDPGVSVAPGATNPVAPSIFPPGTLVRLTRDVTDFHGPQRCAGFEFEIEEFVTAGDPTQDEIDVDFYYGNADGGCNNVCVPANAVELVRTAEQMAARTLPTAEEIRTFLGSALLADGDRFEVDSTTPDGPNHVEGYGRTDAGITFGFRVRVLHIWRTDD